MSPPLETTARVRYTHRVFDSIDKVDLADWRRVRAACGEPFFMDPRFIAAVEVGMRQSCRLWHVIVYDENGLPVACASLSALTIDLANLAHPSLAWIIRRFPRVLSQFRNLRLFLCGLPVSAGQSGLALTSHCNSRQVLSVLDGVVSDLASQAGVHFIVYKEFGEDDLDSMSALLKRGYRRIATAPMHCFRPIFENFQQYRAAVRSHYRYKINRSIRKLQKAHIEISVRSDPEEILRVYTPEVHSLYHQVLERSDTRFETLSIEFFHELTLRLQGQIDLVLLSKDSRVIAFGWCLKTGSTYQLLFVGLDYQLNDELDLYFNLMYAWLDCALQTRASKIEVGQTTDAFKARLGCYSEPLYAFIKGVGPVMSLVSRVGAGLLVAREPATPALNIFKSDVAEVSSNTARMATAELSPPTGAT